VIDLFKQKLYILKKQD